MHPDMWMLLQTDSACVFSLSPRSSPLFYLLFLSVSFIMVRGKLEIKEASIGRQSEWSHSVMLSATHNALQVDSWHILYIFSLWRSLTKCLLMYSSEEMNFYLCERESCSLHPRLLGDLLGSLTYKKYIHINIRTVCAQTHVKARNRDNRWILLPCTPWCSPRGWLELCLLIGTVSYSRAAYMHCKTMKQMWLLWYPVCIIHFLQPLEV